MNMNRFVANCLSLPQSDPGPVLRSLTAGLTPLIALLACDVRHPDQSGASLSQNRRKMPARACPKACLNDSGI